MCGAYVSEDPANARLVTVLHWVLRQLASFCLPGTRLTLLGAAEALDAAGLCVDVVWALEVRYYGNVGCMQLCMYQHCTQAAVGNGTGVCLLRRRTDSRSLSESDCLARPEPFRGRHPSGLCCRLCSPGAFRWLPCGGMQRASPSQTPHGRHCLAACMSGYVRGC